MQPKFRVRLLYEQYFFLSPQAQWTRVCLRVYRQCKAPRTLADIQKMMKGIMICSNLHTAVLYTIKKKERKCMLTSALSPGLISLDDIFKCQICFHQSANIIALQSVYNTMCTSWNMNPKRYLKKGPVCNYLAAFIFLYISNSWKHCQYIH